MKNEKEKILNEATVCYLCKQGEIHLAMKTRKIGKGFWNGYGGGIEPGETIEECVLRELKDESGVIAKEEDIEKIAIVHCHNTTSTGEKFTCTVHFYLVYHWEGEPQETEEMVTPTWFPMNELPFYAMMPTDGDWLQDALNGENVEADVYLGPFQKTKTAPTTIKYVTSFSKSNA